MTVAPRPGRWLQIAAVIGGAVTAATAAIWLLAFERSHPAPEPAIAPTEVARFQRMTELVGLEEMPAASPDGKMVAYVAPDEHGHRQIWVKLLAGGSPLQVTRGAVEAIHPRWLPDSSAIVYLAPPETGDVGTLWEVSTLGGVPRRLTSAIGGADVSHDGRRIAFFRPHDGELALVVLAPDGAAPEITIELPPGMAHSTPRWSPDDQAIAFAANERGFSNGIYVVPAVGGEVSFVVRARSIRGLTWLPDGSGLVYASSAGSTLIYPPIFQLREVGRDGANDRPLTMGDVSYADPDVAVAGRVFASQIAMQSDVWSFPIGGSPGENVTDGVRITRQTGLVQTPSVSPDGKHVTYLSDTGGHSNIWVTSTSGSTARQITFERDPDVLVGLPIWSPAGDRIVFVRRTEHGTGEWIVNPDGSALREIVPSGVSAQWSADGRWLYYYTPPDAPTACIERVPADGGGAERLRCNVGPFAVSSDSTALYFAPNDMRLNLIFKASPPDAEGTLLAEYAAERIPLWPHGFVISPDDRWLALPLKDGATTDIWLISTVNGEFRRITDLARPTLIGRQVSWSADGQSIFAAVAEIDSNIVLLDGLAR